jgi:hypothetical protein
LTPTAVIINQKRQKEGSKRKKRKKGRKVEIKNCIQTKERRRE